MYDNEGGICGIIFNDEPYFFIRTRRGGAFPALLPTPGIKNVFYAG